MELRKVAPLKTSWLCRISWSICLVVWSLERLSPAKISSAIPFQGVGGHLGHIAAAKRRFTAVELRETSGGNISNH